MQIRIREWNPKNMKTIVQAVHFFILHRNEILEKYTDLSRIAEK